MSAQQCLHDRISRYGFCIDCNEDCAELIIRLNKERRHKEKQMYRKVVVTLSVDLLIHESVDIGSTVCNDIFHTRIREDIHEGNYTITDVVSDPILVDVE